jgi:hypothetical protein
MQEFQAMRMHVGLLTIRQHDIRFTVKDGGRLPAPNVRQYSIQIQHHDKWSPGHIRLCTVIFSRFPQWTTAPYYFLNINANK